MLDARTHSIELHMFVHRMTCCGRTHQWTGRLREANYICKDCGASMVAEEEQVRSRTEAEWIVDNSRCPCGGTRIVAGEVLVCGRCDKEFRDDSDS